MDEGTLQQVHIQIISSVLYSPSSNGITNQWYLGDVTWFRALFTILVAKIGKLLRVGKVCYE